MQTYPNEWYARHCAADPPGARAEHRGEAMLLQALSSDVRRQSCGPAPHPLDAACRGGTGDPRRDRGQARRTRTRRSAPGRSSWRRKKGRRPTPILSRFAELAQSDPSPVVRLYLASAVQRLPLEKRWEIVAGLVGHAEDAADHNLPLMYWYAAEPLAAVDASRAAPAGVVVADSAAPGVHGAADRVAGHARIAGDPGRGAGPRSRLGPARDTLDRDRGGAARPPAGGDARGLAQGLRGAGRRRRPAVRSRAVALASHVRRPGGAGVAAAMCSPTPRPTSPCGSEALAALLKVKDPPLPPTLHGLVRDPRARGPGRCAACRRTTTRRRRMS